jgi:hypothetical protein
VKLNVQIKDLKEIFSHVKRSVKIGVFKILIEQIPIAFIKQYSYFNTVIRATTTRIAYRSHSYFGNWQVGGWGEIGACTWVGALICKLQLNQSIETIAASTWSGARTLFGPLILKSCVGIPLRTWLSIYGFPCIYVILHSLLCPYDRPIYTPRNHTKPRKGDV